jgi:imidazolonepropionase-like amidohydrolase
LERPSTSVVSPAPEGSAAIAHVETLADVEVALAAGVDGLAPLQVLRAATARTADAFSLSDRGRIVVGRRADLVMVLGNPIDEITATRDIIRVWRTGVAFRR